MFRLVRSLFFKSPINCDQPDLIADHSIGATLIAGIADRTEKSHKWRSDQCAKKAAKTAEFRPYITGVPCTYVYSRDSILQSPILQ